MASECPRAVAVHVLDRLVGPSRPPSRPGSARGTRCAQSSSVASPSESPSGPAAARARPSTRSSTPTRAGSRARAAGTQRPRRECTSSVSAALHTPGRCTLALWAIATASSRSALRVHVHMAVARRGVHDRHGRVLLQRRLQPLAPARDDQVDDSVLGGQLRAARRGPPPRHERHRARGQPGRRDRRGAPPRRARRSSGPPSRSRAARSRCPT